MERRPLTQFASPVMAEFGVLIVRVVHHVCRQFVQLYAAIIVTLNKRPALLCDNLVIIAPRVYEIIEDLSYFVRDVWFCSGVEPRECHDAG